MNFLAHALLGGDVETDRIGGLIGDFIKGPLPGALPPALAAGVALHRAIDSFAERHAAFQASRARVTPARRRVSGIMVDLFYDHLLARYWSDYGPGLLEEYTAGLYASLQTHEPFLPENAQGVTMRMRTQDWLGAYREVEAIGRAIDRMAVYRFRHANPLAGGIEEFIADAGGFEADFRSFLPDALGFAVAWRAARGTTGETAGPDAPALFPAP